MATDKKEMKDIKKNNLDKILKIGEAFEKEFGSPVDVSKRHAKSAAKAIHEKENVEVVFGSIKKFSRFELLNLLTLGLLNKKYLVIFTDRRVILTRATNVLKRRSSTSVFWDEVTLIDEEVYNGLFFIKRYGKVTLYTSGSQSVTISKISRKAMGYISSYVSEILMRKH